MSEEQISGAEVARTSRRRFLQNAATAAAVAYLTPSCFSGRFAQSDASFVNPATGDAMDQALESLDGLAQVTNHGPMAAEALVALGRADRLPAFVEAYRKRFRSPYPERREAINQQNWREALGDTRRVADWTSFFRSELKEAKWQQVIDHWVDALAPGMAAAAGHGLIRTGHAVRSLSAKETSWRLHELAEGLGYWAGYYQTLPEVSKGATQKLAPAEAIARVPLLPVERRATSGSIMFGLRSINDFEQFAAVADQIDIAADAPRLLSQVTETFAACYVTNATRRSSVTLIHSVTGTTALRSLLPYLSPPAKQKVMRYGWQLASALYSIAGTAPPNHVEPKDINRDELIDRATGLLEEHAIKFTEACVREYALNPKPIYLQAANEALGLIRISA